MQLRHLNLVPPSVGATFNPPDQHRNDCRYGGPYGGISALNHSSLGPNPNLRLFLHDGKTGRWSKNDLSAVSQSPFRVDPFSSLQDPCVAQV